MDPDCAICHADASQACECEANHLEMAVKQAEEHMMKTIYTEIRSWVRAHAQDYVLQHFGQLSEKRKMAHSNHIDRLRAHSYQKYHVPPHPQQLAEAQSVLKHGIDEDWRASVQRYPEVLQYFFGLVELTLPAEDEASVISPTLGGGAAAAATSRQGHRKSSSHHHRRSRGEIAGGTMPAISPSAAMYGGAVAYRDALPLPSRTPPPLNLPLDRRTSSGGMPRDRKSKSYHRSATAHIERSAFQPPSYY